MAFGGFRGGGFSFCGFVLNFLEKLINFSCFRRVLLLFIPHAALVSTPYMNLLLD